MFEKIARRVKNLLMVPRVFSNWTEVYKNVYIERTAGGQGKTGRLELKSGEHLTVRLRGDFLDLGSVLDIFGAGDYAGQLNVPDGSVVLDIGASIGDFSVYCGLHIHGSKVLAFEVAPDAYELLKDNIRANGLLTNVTAFQRAVAGSPGSVNIDGVECEAVTLEGLLNENYIEKCGLCKIDIEGMEYDVLLGTSHEVLKRIEKMVIECHLCTGNQRFAELKDYLENAGFSIRQTRINAYDACLLYCLREQ